jgi:hypothetical protein
MFAARRGLVIDLRRDLMKIYFVSILLFMKKL